MAFLVYIQHQSKEKNSTRIAVDSFETIVSIEHVGFGCPQRHVILQITWLPNNCFWLLNQCFIVSK